MENYGNYYAMIEKPWFAPAPEVFGIAWGIIYPLIIIAGLLLVYRWYQGSVPVKYVWVFAANIIANLAFTPLQLNFPDTWYATADIIIVLGTLAYLQCCFIRSERLLFLLLLPYLLWGAFATVLQVTIYWLNFV